MIQTRQRLKQKNTACLSMLYITMNNARTSYANVIYTAIERGYSKISQMYLLISVKAIYGSKRAILRGWILKRVAFSLYLQRKKKQSVGLSPLPQGKGGKSGQHRALHFLTESCLRRQSNAEENNRPQG